MKYKINVFFCWFGFVKGTLLSVCFCRWKISCKYCQIQQQTQKVWRIFSWDESWRYGFCWVTFLTMNHFLSLTSPPEKQFIFENLDLSLNPTSLLKTIDLQWIIHCSLTLFAGVVAQPISVLLFYSHSSIDSSSPSFRLPASFEGLFYPSCHLLF